jgi:hydroxymethylpyrimidine/phosphomethylpyrimidine kinase
MDYFLTIAASDNSGGAGIQQDLKIAEDLGFWGLSAITGITIQNFTELESIYPIPSEILIKQIEKNINSFHISCVKIGAICSPENIKAISTILRKNKLNNIVLDPVFAPSKGLNFINPESVKFFREELMPVVNIITPNKNELSSLAEHKLLSFDEGIEISQNMVRKYGCNIYLKGGHFEGKTIKEAFISNDEVSLFEKKRLALNYSHGTGCTFSSALSCYLGKGMALKEACTKASEYVSSKYSKLENLL